MTTISLTMVQKRHDQLVCELRRIRSHGTQTHMAQVDSAIGNIEAIMADVYASYATQVDIKSIAPNRLTGM